jgi:hypothetical protein
MNGRLFLVTILWIPLTRVTTTVLCSRRIVIALGTHSIAGLTEANFTIQTSTVEFTAVQNG